MPKSEWKEILKAELFLPDKLNVVAFNADCCKDATILMKQLNARFDAGFKNTPDGTPGIKPLRTVENLIAEDMDKQYCDELYKAVEYESMEKEYLHTSTDSLYCRKVITLWDGCDPRARRIFGKFTDKQRGYTRPERRRG